MELHFSDLRGLWFFKIYKPARLLSIFHEIQEFPGNGISFNIFMPKYIYRGQQKYRLNIYAPKKSFKLQLLNK